MTLARAQDGACEVVLTDSGAPAIRDRATGEVMHPVVGPLVEAEALYVAPSRIGERLREAAPGPLRLLDVGLGAGSNAIAAWKVSARAPADSRRLSIVSFDRTLAAMDLALDSEQFASFGFDEPARHAARELARKGAHEDGRTSWLLVLGSLPATLGAQPETSADIIFWDPFSPRADASLWTTGAFAAVRRLCRAGATLHTYSAATATRSALLLAGFAVGAGEATGAGRPTTMAAVTVADLPRPLDRRWLERLTRSSAPLPADAPVAAIERISSMDQFR